MQSLYAFKGTESDDLKKDEKFLNHSLDSMYDLYLSILALLIELHKKSKDHNEKLQKKLLGTDSDKNPNTKFQNNEILHLISSNTMVQERIAKRKLNYWDLDFEYVDILFKEILKSELYANYINDAETSFKNDKSFILDIYTDIIAPNDKLYDYFEDKRLTWVDDFPVVNTTLLKVLRKLKLTSPETALLPELYKDEDDLEFAQDLFRKTLLNGSKFAEEISAKTTNWDSERLASLDGVLLKMALCEFQKFSSIPYKVTINEYLEIAKAYSTPKSSLFINGILDKVVKEYQSKGIHPKTGRGLM
ncbi:transcription antitermination factor NusB [Winogradskyella echinorum]|uniref:Transcription antitermination factor NusB n=1 Tax=Winogradskyella echinorum TaxID=538189 RepID=A0ABR6Y3H7_9FLAO|nr:transcription antitermination factor NusB [Winogradskyella echinorum]MBC3846800.1 transcription antitermination factor NusB [Winogradskyella echinorum]MBC5751148.1 transcription antitermination factor NusB [Winogradskyella echinorum]